MTNNKRTVKDHFVMLRKAIVDFDIDFSEVGDITQDEMLKFIDGRIDLLDRKTASNKEKMTEAQKANAELREKILEELAEVAEPIPVAYMIKNFECCKGYNSQKITPQLTALVKDGFVVSTKIKGQNAYSAA